MTAPLLTSMEPATLRHLGHALIARAEAAEADDSRRKAYRNLTPEGVERLAEILASGSRPTVRFWRDELVRQGQAEGTIADAHRRVNHGELGSPKRIIGSGKTLVEHYVMSEAAPDDFDAAIAEAKAEGNLSRRNVVRKVKGEA